MEISLQINLLYLGLNKRQNYLYKILIQKDIQIYQNLLCKFFSGGESYDEEGNGIKVGRWIELSYGFRDNSQIIYSCEYKYGGLNILYREDSDKLFKSIAGGLYDKEGDQVKLGKWIELNEKFSNSVQITFNGEYKNQKKIGSWILFTGRSKRNYLSRLVVDSMIKEVMVSRQEIGLNQVRNLVIDHKSQLMFNINMEKKISGWKTFYREDQDKPFKVISIEQLLFYASYSYKLKFLCILINYDFKSSIAIIYSKE